MSFVVALARALVGRPAPRNPEPADARDFPAFLPAENPLESRDGFNARQAAALKLMDEDCYGFLVLTVHRDEGVRGRIELAVKLQREWWPAVSKTLRRIVAVQRAAA